jgi:hypothetical protein
MPIMASLPGKELGLLGTICRLPDLPCPLDGRLGDAPRFASAVVSVPMDIIESDLPCRCPLLLLPKPPLGGTGDLRSPAVEGVLSDNAGLWPRSCGSGIWDAKED